MDSNNRRGEESSGGQADWMATYADMMTLLLTLFVLMFAISNADPQKSALLAAAFSRGGLTPEIYNSIVMTYADPDNSSLINWDTNVPNIPLPQGDGKTGNDNISGFYTYFSEYVESNDLDEGISVDYKDQTMIITLKNDIWFATGSAEINASMKDTAAMLAGMLQDNYDPENPFEIVVSGHTDNMPINTARYPSNWELSVDRAVAFLHVLLEESNLDKSLFTVQGFGEVRPIASNDTSEGRQKNRRVEIYISVPVTAEQE